MQASKTIEEDIIFAYFNYQTIKNLRACLRDFFPSLQPGQIWLHFHKYMRLKETVATRFQIYSNPWEVQQTAMLNPVHGRKQRLKTKHVRNTPTCCTQTTGSPWYLISSLKRASIQLLHLLQLNSASCSAFSSFCTLLHPGLISKASCVP